MTRRFSLIVYGVGILAALCLIYGVTAWSERIVCYADHWSNPNSDMNPNEVNWRECQRHTDWPFSFFSKEQ